MAAVLACGDGAFLSHESAATLGRIRKGAERVIEVTVVGRRAPRIPGLDTHGVKALRPEEVTHIGAIPLTSAIRTLVDLSSRLPPEQLEAAVAEADVENLVDPEKLREALVSYAGRAGVRRLRAVLDRHTYRMTETELERRLLRLVRRADLPLPDTQQQVGSRVDFFWSEFGLVAEADGWRYHRTPARQARDNRRMQEHAAAGRTALRISHYEIRYEPERVEAILARTIARLAR